MPSRLRDTLKKHPRGHGNASGTQHQDELWQKMLNYMKNEARLAAVTDIMHSGYYKVLGKGKLHKQLPIAKANFSEEV
uniref:Uncharacterized protein n=1 Tax=Zonotrichia albicollis TaxID=44394 RepID=A0A8D2LYQ5_ZONAL